MLSERFWSKVDVKTPSECWVWKASTNNKGYGMFTVGTVVGRKLAHRLAYEDTHGQIPDGLFVLHSCDNPRCVNPDHLRAGTAKDNVADMDHRGRRVLSDLRGEAVGTSKLTAEQVMAIRDAYLAGQHKDDIAADFGLSKLSVTDHVSGRSWKHVMRPGELKALKREALQRLTPVTETEVREIWRLHLVGKNVADISRIVEHPATLVANIVSGRTWRHLPDSPSIEALKAGGVRRGFNQFSRGGDTRALNPATKIQSSEIPAILGRLAKGETLQSVGDCYGVSKQTIRRIRISYS